VLVSKYFEDLIKFGKAFKKQFLVGKVMKSEI